MSEYNQIYLHIYQAITLAEKLDALEHTPRKHVLEAATKLLGILSDTTEYTFPGSHRDLEGEKRARQYVLDFAKSVPGVRQE